MYRILEKKILNESVQQMKIEAPLIAAKAKPGQFIILRIDDKGERIPLTIAGYDRKEGTITIIFQMVGKTTMHLGTLPPHQRRYRDTPLSRPPTPSCNPSEKPGTSFRCPVR